MAVKLQEYGELCVARGCWPEEWGTSTITFLGKPSKKANTPANLRPISLLEPCGKIPDEHFGSQNACTGD